MFKAMLLKLMGATFEVRMVSHTTGKDIPGRRIFKGGYWAARKAEQKAEAKLKHGQTVRLQAVTRLRSLSKYITDHEVPRETWDVTIKLAAAAPLSPPVDDHDCDNAGPMDWHDQRGLYWPTCSVCGEFVEE